jgi:hypothetical protein
MNTSLRALKYKTFHALLLGSLRGILATFLYLPFSPYLASGGRVILPAYLSSFNTSDGISHAVP